MSKALVPLSTIADGICAGMGDSMGKYKFTIMRHLLSGYRQLNLYLMPCTEVKTAVLEFDNVIPLPCDFVYQTKVGILKDGHLAVLSLDRSIRRETKSQMESEKHLDRIFCGEYSGSMYPFYNCFRNGQSLGELYGWGRGVHSAGYYNIDKNNGEIYIGSLVPKDAEIVIEYKSDGISDGLKLVPSEVEMTLSYWAKARYYEERGDLRMAQWNEQKYEQMYNQAKRLYNNLSPLYMSAEINKSFSPTNY